ncbi:MAG: prolipoprotein diacylglyceryl transferase [Peptoanaerobacter stomatis]|uniref:prolipoprotein diacylglyceryl transferase n=1 Tax=Peptoanaerobacter stomatis TaxID=796937 RepID=UPI003FA0E3FC
MINPIAFTILGIQVRWYGVIITLGLLIAGYIAMKNARYIGFKDDYITDYVLWAMPFCIIGARLYYVIFEWDYYKGDFFKIINIREGGLVIHGGLIAGFLVAYFYTKAKKINFMQFADIICVSIPLGQSIGRWGNFTNSEAYGTATNLPWAININGQMVHPTFLYESIWNFALFIFLYRLLKKRKFNGQIISLYMIIYSVGRFFIEALRTDSLMILGLKTAQLVSISLIILGVAVYVYASKNNRISD